MDRTGWCIFIIDDDESVRRALRRLVLSIGLAVESFATAEEFLEAPAEPVPSCLILDIHLPGISGLDLQRRLSDEGRRIPVVFITAHADPSVCDLALPLGTVALLHKPFEEQHLLDALAKALNDPLKGGRWHGTA
jgi:FixJ family two-component response regulator